METENRLEGREGGREDGRGEEREEGGREGRRSKGGWEGGGREGGRESEVCGGSEERERDRLSETRECCISRSRLGVTTRVDLPSHL